MATFTVATVAAKLIADTKDFQAKFRQAKAGVEDMAKSVRGLDTTLQKNNGTKVAAAGMKELAKEAKNVAGAVSELALTFSRTAGAQAQLVDNLMKLRKAYASVAIEMQEIAKAKGDTQWKAMADKLIGLNVEMVKNTRALNGWSGEMDQAAGKTRALAAQANDLATSIGNHVPAATKRTTVALQGATGAAHKTRDAFNSMLQFAGGFAAFELMSNLAQRIKAFAVGAIESASRTEQLNIVLKRMGENSNVSTLSIERATKALSELGISTSVAQDTMSKFLRYGLDVSRAGDLARAVQDMAVISGLPSSETLDRVLYGIISRQTEVLRTAGVNVNQEKAFSNYANALGKTVAMLSETEKQQAMVNAVIADAANVQGVYEDSMQSAGKVANSLKRYWADLASVVGEMLLPIYNKLIFVTYDVAKALAATFGSGNTIAGQVRSFVDELTSPLDKAREYMQRFVESGFDLSKVTGALRAVRDFMEQIGTAGKALMAAGFATWIGQLGVVGSLIRPFTGLQGILIALVATNADLRNAFAGLATNVLRVAAGLAQSLAPALGMISDFIDSIAPSVAKLADQLGGLVLVLGGGLIKVVESLTYLLGPVLAALEAFVKVVVATRFALAGAVVAALAFIGVVGGWAIVIGGVVAGLSLLASAISSSNDEQQQLNETTSAYWNNQAKVYGYGRAMSMLKKEMGDTANEAARLTDLFNNASAAEKAARSQQPAKGRWKIGPLEFGGMKVADSMPMGQETMALNAKAQAQAKALTELVAKARGVFEDYANASAAASQQAQDRIASSIAVIDRILGINSATWIDYSKLTTGQIALIEDKVQTFSASTEQWMNGMTSIAEGLKQKEEMGFADLLDFYETQSARIQYFWADLSKLISMGLNQDAVEDLVKAGPMAVGDALGNLITQSQELGDEYGRNIISQINMRANEAKTATTDANRAVVEQLLMTQGAFKATTTAEVAALTEELTGMKQKLMQDSEAVTGQLIVLQHSASSAAKTAAVSYGDAVATFLQVANDASSTGEQVQSALANAAQLGANVVSTDPAQKAIVDQINMMLAIISGNQATLHNAGSQMGINFGNGLKNESSMKAVEAISQVAQIMLNGTSFASRVAGAGIQAWADKMKQDILKSQADATAQAAQMQTAVQTPTLTRPESAAVIEARNRAAKEAAQQADEQQRQAAENARRYQEALANMDWVGKWKEAFDDIVGVMQRVNSAIDGSASSFENLGESIANMVGSQNSAASQSRDLRSVVQGLIDDLRDEAEAMARSGRISNDAASITGYFNKRLQETKDQLPGLVQGFLDSSSAAQSLTDKIKGVTDTWDKYVGVFVDASEATMKRKDSFDQLAKTIGDQRSLLTGAYLSEKQRDEIKRGGTRALNDYVRSVQGEITALQRSGKMTAGQAAANKELKDRLIEVRDQYPELAGEINDYILRLDGIPKEKETESKVLIDEAKLQIDQVKEAIRSIDPLVMTKVQIELDATQAMADLGTVKTAIEDIGTENANVQTSIGNILTGVENIKRAMTPAATGGISNIADAGPAANREFHGMSLYDNGGTLPPGRAITAMNMTGKPEVVFNQDQLRAFAAAGVTLNGGSSKSIENLNLNIYEQQNPREFFERGLWEATP